MQVGICFLVEKRLHQLKMILCRTVIKENAPEEELSLAEIDRFLEVEMGV